jgi:hypothetical protein
MHRTLGRKPDQWNEVASIDKKRSLVERETTRRLAREVAPTLSPSELRAYLYIIGRTFGWQKYAEAIPMSHFLNGLVDHAGGPLTDQYDRIVSAGSGIKTEDSVRKAVASLRDQYLITVFPGKSGTAAPANVYMPLHWSTLGKLLVDEEGGILPACYPGFLPGEFVVLEDRAWQVTDVNGTHLRVAPATDRRRVNTAKSVIVNCDEPRRMTVREWWVFGKS